MLVSSQHCLSDLLELTGKLINLAGPQFIRDASIVLNRCYEKLLYVQWKKKLFMLFFINVDWTILLAN
jgi:hypothetical protein